MFLRRVLKLFTIVLVYTVSGETDDQFKIVETNSGPVRGIRNTTILNGIPFYSFRGIPYAKPPIGDLRFKAPEPVESWKPTVLNASEYGSTCKESVPITYVPMPQSEDCLTLNIFVPADVKPDEKLAALFFIHGGGFHSGSGDDFFYGPDFLVEKQTILVTINYRLGALGFLSLNLTEYSGNMGLKDQQLALKWISSNIEQFGGDSKRITIFGHSAGGISTNFHILSEESRKYFQRAIPMSGSVGNYWAISPIEDHLSRGFRIATNLGEPQTTTKGLIEFFKTVPAEHLISFNYLPDYNHRMATYFCPVIESRDAKQPFLVDFPENLYKTLDSNVDAMFTTVSAEMLPLTPRMSEEDLKEQITNFSEPLPFRQFEFLRGTDEYHVWTNEVRKFYFVNDTNDSQIVSRYFNLLCDLNFDWGIDRSVKSLAANSNGKTFFIRFSVDSKLNAWTKLKVLFKDMFGMEGAGHGDDLCYLFRCGLANEIYDEINRNQTEEQSKISLQTIEYMTKLFTNFAKYGEPSYQDDPVEGFLPVQNDQVNYLVINNCGLTISFNPRQKAMNFWTELEQKALNFTEDLRNEIDSQ